MEVSPLSHEAMSRDGAALNLYPSDYRTAFAFSILPYPQPRGLTLRLAFPRLRPNSVEMGSGQREDYGLTTFRVSARVG
jgi:hypothetical protein